MESTTLMSALDVAALTDTLALSFVVSTGAILHIIWTYLLGSLVMGLMAASSTVIQRLQSNWLHNAREQSPRLLGAGSKAVPTIEPADQPAVSSIEYAA